MNVDAAETCDDENNTRVKKSARKELSDLTSLIRKSSRNHIIKNAKTAVEGGSMNQLSNLREMFAKVNQIKAPANISELTKSLYREV